MAVIDMRFKVSDYSSSDNAYAAALMWQYNAVKLMDMLHTTPLENLKDACAELGLGKAGHQNGLLQKSAQAKTDTLAFKTNKDTYLPAVFLQWQP